MKTAIFFSDPSGKFTHRNISELIEKMQLGNTGIFEAFFQNGEKFERFAIFPHNVALLKDILEKLKQNGFNIDIASYFVSRADEGKSHIGAEVFLDIMGDEYTVTDYVEELASACEAWKNVSKLPVYIYRNVTGSYAFSFHEKDKNTVEWLGEMNNALEAIGRKLLLFDIQLY